MGSKLVDLKRSASKNGGKDKGKGVLGAALPQSDYPPDTSFRVSGDHAKKIFGDSLPSPHTKVKFRGHGEVKSAGSDFGDEDRVHIQVHRLHVEPHEPEEEEEEAPPARKGIRNTIKRSARQVGEDLGDEEE